MSELKQSNNADRFINHHGYSSGDFLQQGETSYPNGILVLDETGSGKKEEFEDLNEMLQSDLAINYGSCARLTDGTFIYEGRL